MIHIWRPWKLSKFQDPPTPLVHLRPTFFHPLDLGRPILNEHTPPIQVITNQLKENIIQEWLLYVIRSFLQVGFRFQYQSINLVWFSFPLSRFPFAFFSPACERTKSKQKQNQVTSFSNWPRILLLDLTHKQCNGIVKEWLHCLTSGSNGRYINAWLNMIFGHDTNPIFLSKKNKEWTSGTLANPPPSTSNNISFLPYSPPSPHPLKVDVICVSSLNRKSYNSAIFLE